MIAIRMRFLSGRMHSTPWGHHANEGVVEYPPSLFRLQRSLVATARRACSSEVGENQLLRILTALNAPPEFQLPTAGVAHTRHYDQANAGVKFFDTFVALCPQDYLLWIWRDAILDEADRVALRIILRSLGTFGRAESWCEAELVSDAELEGISTRVNSMPFDRAANLEGQETIRILLPNNDLEPAALLRVVEVETSKMRKARKLEPDGTRWLTYSRPAGILTPRRSQPQRRTVNTKNITVARYSLHSTVLPLVKDTLPFAEVVRRTLIRARTDNSHSEAITGKSIDGVPLVGHMHAHYIPTDEDGDGRIDHVTIYAARGFDEEDQVALSQINTIWRGHGRPDVRMVLTGIGDLSQFRNVPLLQTATRFRSTTPFSLPRFANRGEGKKPRPRDLPEAQLRRELVNRGLPEPISVSSADSYSAGGRPPVRWLEFHARRYNQSEGFGLAGFELEFAEPQSGPLTLGFASHFGMGLFLPVTVVNRR